MIIQELIDLDEFEKIVNQDEEITALLMLTPNIVVFSTKRAMYAMLEEDKESLEELKSLWPITFDWMEIPEGNGEDGEGQSPD